MSRRNRIVVLLLLALAGCSQERRGGDADAQAATPSTPAPPAPTGDALTDFVRANRVDAVLDAWTVEIGRQWQQQADHMKVKPPPGFWEQAVAEFDMEAERAALVAAVRSGLTEEEMRRDVEWLHASGTIVLGPRLDAVSERAAPLHQRLAAVARMTSERLQGGVPEPLPPLPPVPPRRALSKAEAAHVHALMEATGYAAPEALDDMLIAALRQGMTDVPEAAWGAADVQAAATWAAQGIEAAFAESFSPEEAGRIAAALRSPEGVRHDELMEKLTPLVMSRLEPFGEAIRKHVLRRYAPIFQAAADARDEALKGSPAAP